MPKTKKTYQEKQNPIFLKPGKTLIRNKPKPFLITFSNLKEYHKKILYFNR